MKKYTYLLYVFLTLGIFSCQNDVDVANGYGYLQISSIGLDKNVIPQSRAAEALALNIENKDGIVVKHVDDWTLLQGESLLLPTGIYKLKAYSIGKDITAQGIDVGPYYLGETSITVEKDKAKTVEVVCTLAQSMVSVVYSANFKKAFSSFNCSVSNEYGSVNVSENQAAYLRTGKALKAVLNVVNTDGKSFKNEKQITDNAQARYFYKVNYDVTNEGTGSFNVTVDQTTHEYEINITVPVTSDEDPALVMNESVNTWATFAEISGTSTLDDNTGIIFQYKLATSSGEWQSVTPTLSEGVYTAKISGLTGQTTYISRMNVGGKIGNTVQFTTEEAKVLPYSNFDTWVKSGSIWYVGGADTFWDSGNAGAGSIPILGKNPTTGDSGTVHTAGGQSAKLASTAIAGVFAAGNLYVGKFIKTIGTSGAEIQFGRPFTSRPTQLHGWYNYASGTVDKVGGSLPSTAEIGKNDADKCAIYIFLSDKGGAYTVNTSEGKFIDLENDPNIIAYGALPDVDCVTTNGWKEFTLDLVYRSLTRKPTHLVIVTSASKYGDYFTGSTSSVMYIDDFELIYGNMPLTK